jgi:hypothetical protein
MNWPYFAYFVVVSIMALGWILVPALKEMIKELKK